MKRTSYRVICTVGAALLGAASAAAAQDLGLEESAKTELTYNEAEERMSRLLRLQTIQRKLEEGKGAPAPRPGSQLTIPPELLQQAITALPSTGPVPESLESGAGAGAKPASDSKIVKSKNAPQLLWTTTSSAGEAAMIDAGGMQNSVRKGSVLPGGWQVESIVPNGVKLRRGKEVHYLKAGQ